MRITLRRTVIFFSALVATSAVATVSFLAAWRVDLGDPLRISANNWIGYAPLFYVKEKKWARDDVLIVPVSSLVESEKLFQAGMTDGFAGTQFEYFRGQTVSRTLIPKILIDRSNGADVILSNVPLEKLKRTVREATVYLEMQTVNNSLFSAFVREYGLSHVRFRKIDRDQVDLAATRDEGEPILLVTYEPYSTELVNRGFTEIASTKNVSLLVLDAVFIDGDSLARRPGAAVALQDGLARAISVLKEDPFGFYLTVRPYLKDQSYGEFIAALEGIEWLVDEVSPELRASAKDIGVPLDWIER